MPEKSKSHLTYEERCQIYAHLKSGKSLREIGRLMSRCHSTISREIARNQGERGYRFRQAQMRSEERRVAVSSKPSKMTEDTIHLIKKMMEETQLSPQQLSGRLKYSHQIQISHESIYRLILRDQKEGGDLFLNLRRKAKKYNKRQSKKAGRGLIPNRVDIDQRPAIVEQKTRLGDFEVDTLVGKNHCGAIVSMVDRASKYTYLALIPRSTQENVKNAICKRLGTLGRQGLVRTITSDNGKEFASHQEIVKTLGGCFFFAKPYHSWERGLNEHTNGLVRQYFPKGTDFSSLKQEDVLEVERRLNQRPRVALNFRTPTEVFLELMTAV